MAQICSAAGKGEGEEAIKEQGLGLIVTASTTR